MKKHRVFLSLPFKLLAAVAIGMILGLVLRDADQTAAASALLNILVTIKFILGQLINFCVPLIIIGFVAPSITRMGASASRMLAVAVGLAYLSSIGAAFFSMTAGVSPFTSTRMRSAPYTFPAQRKSSNRMPAADSIHFH